MSALVPLSRITPIAPEPGGVDKATIVLSFEYTWQRYSRMFLAKAQSLRKGAMTGISNHYINFATLRTLCAFARTILHKRPIPPKMRGEHFLCAFAPLRERKSRKKDTEYGDQICIHSKYQRGWGYKFRAPNVSIIRMRCGFLTTA